MVGELIRALYRYNAWANGRVLDTAERLTPEQLVAGGGASFGSVRDTLVHTMGAQWLYLERWEGRSPRAMLDPREFPDLASIQRQFHHLLRCVPGEGLVVYRHGVRSIDETLAMGCWTPTTSFGIGEACAADWRAELRADDGSRFQVLPVGGTSLGVR